ncbi:MAG: hypothetical protein IJZ91_05850 [Oscillospiraceae bacterium]|nr:hypothetical protein [Oscillospiraceae bacterium]
MGTLTYSKKIKIENKIIKESDVILFAQLLQEQFSEEDYTNEISLCFEDESRLSGNDIDIFSSDEFKRRRCKSVNFELASSGFERVLKIELNNPVSWLEKSFVEVRSTDKVWYESMLNRIETVIDGMEDQVSFMRHPYVLAGGISIAEAIILVLSLFRVLSLRTTVYGYIVFIFLSGALLFVLNFFLVEKLKTVYPQVEFAFGPTHNNKVLKQRKIIALLIPLVLDIVLGILGFFA